MPIKTGFAKVLITPPLDSPIIGYYAPRHVKGVIDDLYIRAIAFDDGTTKSLVISADLCYTSKVLCDEYRTLISEYCSIPRDAIFISFSHTHTGPLVGHDFASDAKSNPAYEEFLKFCFRDAAAYALADLKPSEFYTAQTQAKNISFIRRYRMKDGSVRTNPGVGNPDIDHPLGTPNETVKLLKIVREDTDNIYIVNFGTHADTVAGEYISADWPGYVCSTIENAIPGTKCVCLVAPQGDVNHINVKAPYEKIFSKSDANGYRKNAAHAIHMGRVIAGAVLSVCTLATKINADSISYGIKDIALPTNRENHRLEEARKINDLYEAGRGSELPYSGMELTTIIAEARRILRLEHGPDFYYHQLIAIRIGDFVFAGTPGEPFTEIGDRIYEGSVFDTTMLCCLTNGPGSYFPSTKALTEGGYEARGSALTPGCDDIIVNSMCELLKEIR